MDNNGKDEPSAGGQAGYKQLYEGEASKIADLSNKLDFVMRLDTIIDVFDSDFFSDVNSVKRDNLKDVLHDISKVFKEAGGFVHSEINVFRRDVESYVGLPYTDFMKMPLSDIIDSSVSGFSAEDLSLLEKEIKQTSYLLINSGGMIYVKGVDNKAIRAAYKMIYDTLSSEEVDDDASYKFAKMMNFGLHSHFSTAIYPYAAERRSVRKVPLGYFHLTKRFEFSEFEFCLINRVASRSSMMIDRVLNPPLGVFERLKNYFSGHKSS